MEDLWKDVAGYFTEERLRVLAQALATLAVGLLAGRLLSAGIVRLVKLRGVQSTLLVRRITFYSVVVLSVVAALQVLGVDLSLLLGAAGILTVAIGFASQTSASNIISGLFLISERPFVIGDVIEVEDVTGEVITIDALSVKLRTFDNRFVRVPNESLLKSRITNLSHFPIRRIDIVVGVAYREDLERVREVLFRVAESLPMALDEPKPLFQVLDFADSAVTLQFSVWVARENFWDLRTRLRMAIKAAFDAEGVEIPFPHRTLYTGAVTEPLPIRIVGERATGAGAAPGGEGDDAGGGAVAR